MGIPIQSTHLAMTDPGSGVNEDIGGATGQAAWVLDGATGVGEGGFTPRATDAQWYVQQFDRYLRTHIDDHDRTLSTIVRQAIQTVADEFSTLVEDREIAPTAKPSAAGAISRWTDDTLETFIIADCSIILVDAEGMVTEITDQRPFFNRIKRESEHAMYRLVTDRGMTFDEARESLRPKLVDDLRKLRTSDEQWALCLTPTAAEDGHSERFDFDSLHRIMICSDGFSRLIDTFDSFGSWEEAASWITEHGIEQAFKRLRTIEQNDPNCSTYPRTKTHDDATMVAINFG
jgi:hypothetical protein